MRRRQPEQQGSRMCPAGDEATISTRRCELGVMVNGIGITDGVGACSVTIAGVSVTCEEKRSRGCTLMLHPVGLKTATS